MRSRYRLPVLFAVGVADGSVFPFPIGMVVGAMVLAKPGLLQATIVTAIVTAGNLAGGLTMASLGAFAFEAARTWFGLEMETGLAAEVSARIQENAWLTIFAASFPPVPYPFAMLVAGAAGAPLWALITASVVGKAIRYGVLAFPLAIFGERAVQFWLGLPVWARRSVFGAVGFLLFLVLLWQLL